LDIQQINFNLASLAESPQADQEGLLSPMNQIVYYPHHHLPISASKPMKLHTSLMRSSPRLGLSCLALE
jgi:hypothetical protein